MERNGGLITAEDLRSYIVAERLPVEGTYKDYKVVSMPPSSSGGIHLIQMLNMLEDFPIKSLGFGSADSIHILAEVMKRAYSDRSKYLGDSDFYDVPSGLVSKEYAKIILKFHQIILKDSRNNLQLRPPITQGGRLPLLRQNLSENEISGMPGEKYIETEQIPSI